MRYAFVLCPKCKDRLIEQALEDFQECKETYCPNCGSIMEKVLSASEKTEDTIYKITLKQVRDMRGRRDKCLDIIMQIGNLNENEALEKLNTKDSVIFEGDLLNTYLNLRLLDEIDYMVDYTVTPRFPYTRSFTPICPDCGKEADYKMEEIGEDDIQEGFFCERCNEWFMYGIYPKSRYDKTLYHLRMSLKGVEGKVRKEILRMLSGQCDKEIIEDQVVVHDLARNISSLLGLMQTYNIHYEIDPPYPHKIIEFKKEWTEEDIKLLMEANPGLKLDLDEMNALY